MSVIVNKANNVNNAVRHKTNKTDCQIGGYPPKATNILLVANPLAIELTVNIMGKINPCLRKIIRIIIAATIVPPPIPTPSHFDTSNSCIKCIVPKEIVVNEAKSAVAINRFLKLVICYLPNLIIR